MKTQTKVITSIIALILSAILLFVSAVIHNTGKTNVVATTMRTVALEKSSIDAQSILNEFDNATLTTEGTTTYFEGFKPLDIDRFSDIDYISDIELEQLENCMVKYNFSYDSESNIVTIAANATLPDGKVEVDEIQGIGFINDNDEIDAVMNIDGEYILLSELKDAGLIENCGLFSLFKKIAVAVTAVVVVAAVAATIAFTAGAGAVAVIAVGAVAGGLTGGVAGGAISYSETGEIKLEYVLIGIGAGAAIGAAVGATVYSIGSAIKTSSLISKNINMQKIGEHVFSQDHINKGIMKLGNSQDKILNKFFDIAVKNADKWVEGSNEIHTIINGYETTIRFFIQDGKIINLDGFIGISDRVIGFLINLL